MLAEQPIIKVKPSCFNPRDHGCAEISRTPVISLTLMLPLLSHSQQYQLTLFNNTVI